MILFSCKDSFYILRLKVKFIKSSKQPNASPISKQQNASHSTGARGDEEESLFFKAMRIGLANSIVWDRIDLENLLAAVPLQSIGQQAVTNENHSGREAQRRIIMAPRTSANAQWRLSTGGIPKIFRDNDVRIVYWDFVKDARSYCQMTGEPDYLKDLKLYFYFKFFTDVSFHRQYFGVHDAHVHPHTHRVVFEAFRILTYFKKMNLVSLESGWRENYFQSSCSIFTHHNS